MLIEFIKICNWRSFYGENEIWVATDSNSNVTLIRAENGVGKTSLLAAINWCFFDILPSESEFENPKNLVNEFSIKNDGQNIATVEIDFTHSGKTYRASRSYDQNTETTRPLRLTELFDGGEVPSSARHPDRFINSVIPREMAPHFFFYGEATSRYTGTSGAKKFGEAVKGILGSTVARMALEDLGKALKDYRRQAADNTSAEARAVEKGIEELDQQITQQRGHLDKLENEIDVANDRIDRLNQELAGARPAKDAQARRDHLEAELAERDKEKSEVLQKTQKWMQTFGISILAKELVAEAGSVIKEEDTRGKLPAPYDQKFVDEILEDGICVCGRPVEKDSREHERIKSLLETAGDQAVMSRVMTTNVMLGGLIEKERYAWRDHERNNEDLRKLEGEIRRLDADLLAISKELAENPISEIADKETARERAIAQRSQATERRVAAEVAIASFKREMAEQRNRLNQLTKESQAARRYVKRAHVAGALTAQLNERLRKEEESARAEIESEINSIIEEFMRKPALAKIDQDYQLRLFDEQGAELAKSTGENQLLGLAFTGAIAKYAKDRASVEDDILLPGTVAPLVVDSPFGHLDPTYRRGVAEFLPNLASQVILMVSTSQASEAVMTGLAEKIGVEYVLTRHNRTDGAGKAPESIEIGGACYNLTTYNSEIVGTRVTEVRK